MYYSREGIVILQLFFPIEEYAVVEFVLLGLGDFDGVTVTFILIANVFNRTPGMGAYMRQFFN